MVNEQVIFPGITEEEAREYNNLYKNGGLEAVTKYLEGIRDRWKDILLNIGIIGNSGSGKSSFINAIRNLTGDDEGAAAVGVTETTAEPTPYTHPNNEKLKFWDLPGVGTLNFTKEEYLKRIGFDKFDFFLIIASVRFTENDKWLAEEITQRRKQFFFLRTKIHNDIRDDKYDHPKTHTKEAVLTRIADNIRKNLRHLYIDGNVFLIDNHKRNMYDFEKLEQRIVEEFPSIKREALVLSLTAQSEWMIKEKAKTLQKYIWISCITSGAVALNPIPGTSLAVDGAIVLAQAHLYFRQLGLDEKSLKRTAEMTSCDANILHKLVDDSVKDLLTREGIIVFAKTTSTVVLLAAEEGARLIPILGPLVASVISFGTTYQISNELLTKMEETALLVARTAVKHSANQLGDKDSEKELQ